MKQTAGQRRGPHASAFHRLLTALLVALYVIVGFGGEVSCAKESLEAGGSFDVSAVMNKSDEGSRKGPATVEHCYTCAPVVMPVLAPVAVPSAEPVKLCFEAPTFLLEDHPGLDTPPPKRLT
jgi:hypothetical protein